MPTCVDNATANVGITQIAMHEPLKQVNGRSGQSLSLSPQRVCMCVGGPTQQRNTVIITPSIAIVCRRTSWCARAGFICSVAHLFASVQTRVKRGIEIRPAGAGSNLLSVADQSVAALRFGAVASGQSFPRRAYPPRWCSNLT